MSRWPVPLPVGAVDSLAFAGNWPNWPVPGPGENALLKRMERLGMRVAVLLSLTTVYGDVRIGNDELADLVRRHPGHLAGLVTFDPRRSLLPEQVMQRGRNAGLCGLALFPMHHGYGLGDDPRVEQALAQAEAWAWPLVVPIRLVMSWTLPSTSIQSILRAAGRHPGARFLIAGSHSGEAEQLLHGMAELPNLYVETSCNQGSGALVEMVTRGDPARIMLGTGQPVQMPECNLVKLSAAALDEQTREAVLHRNATRFYSLVLP